MNLSIQPFKFYTSPSFSAKGNGVAKAAQNLPAEIKNGIKSDAFLMDRLKNDYSAYIEKIKELKNKLEQCIDPDLSAKYQKRIDYLENKMERVFRGWQRIKSELEKEIAKYI